MNTSEEFPGLSQSLDRVWEKTEEEKKRAEEEKKRLDERVKILSLLRKANEEIQGIKKSKVGRDEMAEFFEKFLNEFSHAIESIEDPKVKGILKRTLDAFRRG